MHKKIKEMIKSSIGEEICDKYYATVEDRKATIYNSITGEVIEEGIESQIDKGGLYYFIFCSKKIRRRFAYPTNGGSAEWLTGDTFGYYIREQNDFEKYKEHEKRKWTKERFLLQNQKGIKGMKKYSIIYADPPWEVKAGPDWGSNSNTWDLVCPTMSLEEIKKIPIKGIAEKECVLFLWTINKYVEQSYQVAKAWGFKPSTLLTWCKKPNGTGLGGTFSLTTEFLLFAWRGKCGAVNRHGTTWWNEKRGKHSRKPKLFRDIIEDVFPNRSKIELFAREKHEGWDVLG